MPHVRDDPDHPDPGFADLYARMPYATDLEPWLGWASRARPPVLYLGIGTGRLAVPLARAGVRLMGVDAHPGMLAHARSRLPDVELVQSRIEDLDLGSRFDLVIGPASVLGKRENLAAAARHLAPAGRVGLELMNRHWLDAYSGARVRVLERRPGWLRMEIDYVLPDGEIITQDVEGEPPPGPEDAEAYLAAAGLRLISMSGSSARLEERLEDSPTYYLLAASKRLRSAQMPST